MISHYNVIAQCYQMRQLQVDPDRVKILAIMPLYHGKLYQTKVTRKCSLLDSDRHLEILLLPNIPQW